MFSIKKKSLINILILFLFSIFLFFVSSFSLKSLLSVYAYSNDVILNIKKPTGDFYSVYEGAKYDFFIENVESKPMVKFCFVPDSPKFENYYIGKMTENEQQEEFVEIDGYVGEDINKGSKLSLFGSGNIWTYSLVFKTNGTVYTNIEVDGILKISRQRSDITNFDIDAPTIDYKSIDFSPTTYAIIYEIAILDKTKSLTGSSSGIKRIDLIKDLDEKDISDADKEMYRLLTDIRPQKNFDDYLTIVDRYEKKFISSSNIEKTQAFFDGKSAKFNVSNDARYYLRLEDNAGNVNYYFLFYYNKTIRDFRYFVDIFVGVATEETIYVKPTFDIYMAILNSMKEKTNKKKYNYFLEKYEKETKVFESGPQDNDVKRQSYQQMQEYLSELREFYMENPEVVYHINGLKQIKISRNLSFEIENIHENIEEFLYGDVIHVYVIFNKVNLKTSPSISPNRKYNIIFDVKINDNKCKFQSSVFDVNITYPINFRNIKVKLNGLDIGYDNKANNNAISLISSDIMQNISIEYYDIKLVKIYNVCFYILSAFFLISLFVAFVVMLIEESKFSILSNYFYDDENKK